MAKLLARPLANPLGGNIAKPLARPLAKTLDNKSARLLAWPLANPLDGKLAWLLAWPLAKTPDGKWPEFQGISLAQRLAWLPHMTIRNTPGNTLSLLPYKAASGSRPLDLL